MDGEKKEAAGREYQPEWVEFGVTDPNFRDTWTLDAKGSIWLAVVDILQFIAEHVKWDEKTQIVLQYDPRQNKSKLMINHFPDEQVQGES